MNAFLLRLVIACSLVVSVQATETGDILTAFNDAYIEGPSTAYEYWDGTGSIQSNTFQNYYRQVYEQYFTLTNRLASRTVACARGDIPQSEGYVSSPAIIALVDDTKAKSLILDANLQRWLISGDETALQSLDSTIPTMTIAYGKMLFELSKCSGFLYGELVN